MKKTKKIGYIGVIGFVTLLGGALAVKAYVPPTDDAQSLYFNFGPTPTPSVAPTTTPTPTPLAFNENSSSTPLGGLQFPSEQEFLPVGSGLQFVPELQTSSHQAQVQSGLVKVSGQKAIFYVNSNGFKTWVPTLTILKSYGGKESDVRQVSQEEFDSYKTTDYITLKNSGKVYRISGRKKVLVSSDEVSGLQPGQAMEVNKTELAYYNK